MRSLIQFSQDGMRGVAALDAEGKAWRLEGTPSVLALATDALAQGATLAQLAEARRADRLRLFILTFGAIASLILSNHTAARDHPFIAAAKWIAPDGVHTETAGAFHFRKTIDLAETPATVIVGVSADNRYRLYVNGTLASSGPARSDPLNWRYETLDIAPYLRRGRNVIAAIVWNWGEHRPIAQMSVRTGFVLQAKDKRYSALDTGGSWKVFSSEAYSFAPVLPPDDGGYYAAAPREIVDAGRMPWGWEQPDYDDSRWSNAKPIASSLLRGTDPHGVAGDWQLVPRNIPAMEERIVRIAKLRSSVGIAANPSFLTGARPLRIPPHSKVSLLLDQQELINAYPVLLTNGGAGATATLTYAEALFDSNGNKGNRNEVAGRTIHGVADQITFDGGTGRRFQSLWFRAYRYVQLDVQTSDQPLEIRDFHSIYTGYPFVSRSAFSSDQQWIAPVWDLNWRSLRISAFETFMDTPYYEQLQYVGDTRIESLLSVYMTGDDRLMRNAIELFDASRSPEGITASRYPSDPAQYIPPFSLWWIAMVHDYWMLRDDPAFVSRFLPGIRGVLNWYERHVDETGMLGPMPWWNFLDWDDAFERGSAPGSKDGHSTALTLQYVYALRQAADLETSFGHSEMAASYQSTANRVVAAVRQRTWNSERKLFSDTAEKASFSQQTNALAVLTGAAEDPRLVTETLLTDPRIMQASYYFRFYVDEAMQLAGLGDRYIERLGPWRDMIAKGLTTTAEKPDPTRSDSHAWSAHPNYFLLATVLGIRSGSPGFKTVTIAPSLGALSRATGRMPHPAGEIQVELRRTSNSGIQATITLPPGISGIFKWRGRSFALQAGRNSIAS